MARDIDEDQIIQDALLDCPGAAYGLAQQQARRAAWEFCELSLAWRDNDDSFTITTDADGNYTVDVAGFLGEVILPTWVKLDGAQTTLWTFQAPSTLTLASLATTVAIEVAMRPKQTKAVDTSICTEFYEGLLAGTKSRLMAMPQKPWTNGVLAVAMRRHFRSKITEAKLAANRAGNPAAQTWRFPYIAGRR